MVVLILAGSVLASLLAVAGARHLLLGARARRAIAGAVHDGELVAPDQRLVVRLDRSLQRTTAGRRLQRELTLAGIERSASVVLAVAVSLSAVASYVIGQLVAGRLALLAPLVGAAALYEYIRRGRARRLEAFIGVMPELARVLSNATHAGLSIHTAIGVAAGELPEPARSELERVSSRLAFGVPLDAALSEMRERLPSREVGVLLSTLLVSSRAGGSLVTALRQIAETLEARKETRREVQTTLAQSTSTGYVVIALGLGQMVVINLIQPGSVDAILSSGIGRLALAVSTALFVIGFLLVRRLSRVEL